MYYERLFEAYAFSDDMSEHIDFDLSYSLHIKITAFSTSKMY